MFYPQLDAFQGSSGTIRIIGHRGARGLFPENSMVGFENVLRSGINLIELDIVFSKDKIPIITHDYAVSSSFSRHVGGKFIQKNIEISSLTAEQVKNYEIGKLNLDTDYGKRFPEQIQLDGVYMPTLQELYDKIQQPDFEQARLMVEIKPNLYTIHDDRKNITRLLVKQIRDANLTQKVILHSFDWLLLEECKNQAPEIITSFLSKKVQHKKANTNQSVTFYMHGNTEKTESIPEKIRDLGGSIWCPYFKDITRDRLLIARENNLLVAVWTVNEPSDIDEMIKLGVDAIMTDYPPRVKSALISKGMGWQN